MSEELKQLSRSPSRSFPICKDHVGADWNQPVLEDDACVLCRLFYLEAQEGLLEVAQQRAERAEDAIKDMQRPLDAQMARLNAEVTRLNVENELLRSAASRSERGRVESPSAIAIKPTAYIWHDHLGPDTKSLRWSKPNQFEYACSVTPLYESSSTVCTPHNFDPARDVACTKGEYAQLVYDARRYEWLRDHMRRMPLGEKGARHFFDQPGTMSFQEAVDAEMQAVDSGVPTGGERPEGK